LSHQFCSFSRGMDDPPGATGRDLTTNADFVAGFHTALNSQ
jgi:hypothetical protein